MNSIYRSLPAQLSDEILKKLAPDRLKLILRDHELIEQGFHIYFAVDHFETRKFCFPINVSRIGEYSKYELDKISSEQNAYFEIFYKNTHRPIIMKEYMKELDGLWRYLADFASKVYAKSELIEAYIKAIDVNKESLEKIKSKTEIIEFLKGNFNNILAVASGICSIGSERLSDIVNNRFMFEKFDDEDKEYSVHFKEVNISNNAKLFFEILQINQPLNLPRELYQLYSRQKKYRDRRDADTIDKLLKLNYQLNKNKILILYLSSALKSSELFRHSEVQELQPVILDKKHSILRTTDDIYAYLLRKGDDCSSEEKNRKTINNIKTSLEFIEKIKQVKNQLKEIENKCQSCQGNETIRNNCGFKEICKGLEEYAKLFEQGRQDIFNIALVRTLNDFVSSFQEIKEQDPYYYYIEFVKRINNEETKNAILKEVQTIYNIVSTKCAFLSSFPLDLSEWIKEPVYEYRRYISCVLQEFPFKLKIKDETLKDILEEIRKYVMTPQKEKYNKLDILKIALGQYMQFDAKQRMNPESDLIRAYIYLVCQRKFLIEKAYQLCDYMIKNEKDIEMEIKVEFRYIMTFAARHLGRYEECNQLCKDSIISNPNDARFYHARALNTFAWIEEKETGCQMVFSDVLNDLISALNRYDKIDKLMIGVIYNNLTYFHSYKKTESYDLNKALKYLEKLKTQIPKEEWYPTYPEFYDTEATLYYAYYSDNKTASDCFENLQTAHDSIRKAIELDPHSIYFRKEIEIREALSTFFQS